MANDDKTMRDKVVRLTKLAVDPGVIEGYTFLGCQINGPAVVVPQGCKFANSDFDGDIDAILWEIPLTRPVVVGALLLKTCVFDHCRFSNLGFAGPPDLIKQLRDSLKTP